MKTTKSPKEGHVLLELHDAGVTLLAEVNPPAPPYQTDDHSQFMAFLNERETKPLRMHEPIGCWHFGINE